MLSRVDKRLGAWAAGLGVEKQLSRLRRRQSFLAARAFVAAGKTPALSKVGGFAARIPGLPSLGRSVVGIYRPHATLAEAEAALRAIDGRGHANPSNAEIHLRLSEVPRPSDYAALFHLLPRLDNIRTIFDLGGNVGNLFYCYTAALPGNEIATWTVMDVPDMLQIGRDVALERGASRLRFTTELADASGCDVYLASGSMHYFAQPLPDMIGALAQKPRFLLVNRTPMTDGAPFAAIQEAGSFRVACMVYNRGTIIAQFEALGYRLVDQWRAPELSLYVPLHIDKSVPDYTGFFMERVGGCSVASGCGAVKAPA